MRDNRRLGLGLDALLGGVSVEPVAVEVASPSAPKANESHPSESAAGAPSPARNGEGLVYAAVDELRPNPHQPRKIGRAHV